MLMYISAVTIKNSINYVSVKGEISRKQRKWQRSNSQTMLKPKNT